MGLDIHIGTDNYKEVYSPVYFLDDAFRKKRKLSRTFCNFMARRHMVQAPAELDQLGKLVNVDISPIYQMEEYVDEEYMSELLFDIEDAGKKETLLEKMHLKNELIKGNIDRVLKTVEALINQLSHTDDLEKKLTTHGYDTLGNDVYFSNFNDEQSENDFTDHFGEDMRNFKRFLEYAKSKGTTTIYFNYG